MIFGTYSGPGFASVDFRDNMEAFSSERSAKLSLKARQWSTDMVDRVHFDGDGYATISEGECVECPAATNEDYIDLYHGVAVKHVESSSGREWSNWIIDDQPYARLYFGPRGGVRKENF